MKQADKMADVLAKTAQDLHFWQGTGSLLLRQCKKHMPEIDGSKPVEEFWAINPTHFVAMLDSADVIRALASKGVLLWKSNDGTFRLVLHNMDFYPPEHILERAKGVGQPVGATCKFCHLRETDVSEFCDQFKVTRVNGLIHSHCLGPWDEWRRESRRLEKLWEENQW